MVNQNKPDEAEAAMREFQAAENAQLKHRLHEILDKYARREDELEAKEALLSEKESECNELRSKLGIEDDEGDLP